MFVYQIESYRYWQEFLDRDDFTYGQFGENFTVQGLADDEVCIGDRYRIGSALFEVSQPRVTCYRVGIRMRLPQMPSLLVAHRRPGFYLRVLDEGEVQAGDTIELVTRGLEAMTVVEIDSLLYLPGEPHGAASGYLHASLRVGDVIEAGAPRGSFVLHGGDHPVVLISAGVGATPVLAMLHALAGERSPRQVWWLHGARNSAEHAFEQEARALLEQLLSGRIASARTSHHSVRRTRRALIGTRALADL